MVFKQNEQSFAYQMSDQFAYEHPQYLAYADQRSPFAEDIPCDASPLKSPASDEDQKSFSNYHHDFENVTADPHGNSHNDLSGNLSLSCVTGWNSEDVWLDNGKRSLCHHDTCLHASKRSRQEDQNLQFGSFEGRFTSHEEPALAAAEFKDRGTSAVAETAVNQNVSSHCYPPNTGQESILDPSVQIYSHPSYLEDTSDETDVDEIEEPQSPAFDYFGRKHVSIGKNHQADVPEWKFHEYDHNEDDKHFASPSVLVTSSSRDDHLIYEDNDKWAGTCATPMPMSAASDVVVLEHKMDCRCTDEGSVRCVRQHVTEARDRLRQNLGLDRFVALGFSEMGEIVAENWTQGEEQLFHEVVLSNPASLGKNFWNILPQVFPSRSSKELVSYYFNVFMLRKRAGQNRFDPVHVDSDNDEWQDSDDGVFAINEEDDDEDSAVESPLSNPDDDAGEIDDLEEEEITEETDDIEDSEYHTLPGDGEAVNGVPKGHIVGEFMKSNLNQCEEQEIQDDSCTSFDVQQDLIEDHVNFHKDYRNDGLNGLTDNGFFGGHCDPKTWEINYSCGADKDDFLPTCNLIEEVFGKDAFEK